MPVESFTLLVQWLMLCPFFVLRQVCEKASGRWIDRLLTKAELKERRIRFRKESDDDDDEDDDEEEDEDDDDVDDGDDEDIDDFDDNDDENE